MTTPSTELEKALKKGVIFPSEIAKFYEKAGYGAKNTATSINAVFNKDAINYNEINKVFDKISKTQESIANPNVSVNEKKTTALNSIVATSLAQQISKDLPKDTIAIWTASSSANPSLSHMAYYGREFVLSEGINGELPGQRPNCQCGFIIKNLPKNTETLKNTDVEIREAPPKTIAKVKKEAKLTKTEQAFKLAKERNITTTADIQAIMKELDINSGAVFNKLKKEFNIQSLKDQGFDPKELQSFWRLHGLIKSGDWRDEEIWDSKRQDYRPMRRDDVVEARAISARYLIHMDRNNKFIGKYFDFIKKIAEST